jgi:multiple sugar transport system substrate-binding protein
VIHFFAVESIGTDWALYRALADCFQEVHPEFIVEIEAGLQPSLTGVRASADCFVDHAYRARLGSEGGILPLDPLAAGDETFDRDVFYPAFLRQTEIGGKLMALPLETTTKLLYYNRALFDDAGLPYPTARWTPQNLVEQAVALTDTSAPKPVYGFSPRDGVDAASEYVAWLGGQLFDQDDRPTFDHPSAVAAMALYADLIRSAPPPAQKRSIDRWSGVVTTAGTHPPSVSSGQVAMWIDEYHRHLGSPPLDFDVGLVSLPVGAASLAGVSSSRALYISAQTDVPDACWAWMTFLSAQPEAVQWLPVRRGAWRAGVGEELAAAWSSILSQSDLQPPSGGYSMASTYALYWLDEALADVLAGTPPADALVEAQAKASVFVSCMNDSDDPRGAWPTCARQADPDVVLPSE